VGEVDEKDQRKSEAPKPGPSIKKTAKESVKVNYLHVKLKIVITIFYSLQKAAEPNKEAAGPVEPAVHVENETKSSKNTSVKSAKGAAAAPPKAETKAEPKATEKKPEPPKKEQLNAPTPKPAAEAKPEPVVIPSGKSVVSGKVLDGWL